MRLLHFSLLIVCGLLVAGCQRPASSEPENVPPTVQVNGESLPISGPYSHENLSVFLIHSSNQDSRCYITLDEGLTNGSVAITEKAQEQVNELQIENKSDSPLFLQEGDRLQGGKQDRTIYASLVVAPHSGVMPLPAFCIEQSRWQRGGLGGNFGQGANPALAPKNVRCAAKIYKDQGAVWNAVLGQKVSAEQRALAGNSNSSLNETLESPKVKEISEKFAAVLGSVLDDHADAVGVAIVVNGHIEEVNVYPNHQLLRKLYPRLIQSYALQATTEKDKAKDAQEVAADDLVRFMSEGQEKNVRTTAINDDNRLQLREMSNKSVECRTQYDGGTVHYQLLSDAVTTVPSQQRPEVNANPDEQAPNASPEPQQRRQPRNR